MTGSPTTLLAIEAEAEVAHDTALVSDFAGVRAIAAVIVLEWAAFRARIDTGVDESWVEGMDDRVASFSALSRVCRNKVSMARAANEVGRWVGETLCVYYRPGLPPPIVRMNSLAREISLDVMARDLRAAATHSQGLRAAWVDLRQTVEMLGDRARIAPVDTALEAVALAIARGDASQVREDTATLLTEVRLLEVVFDGLHRSEED